MQVHIRVMSTCKRVSVQQAQPGLCFLQGHQSLHFTNNCSDNCRCYYQLLQEGNKTCQDRRRSFCTAKHLVGKKKNQKRSSCHSTLFMADTEDTPAQIYPAVASSLNPRLLNQPSFSTSFSWFKSGIRKCPEQ